MATLKYGKALKGYQSQADGPVRVYGTNGPVGYTDVAQSNGPGVIIGRKGAYRGVHYSTGPFWVIDTAYYLEPTHDVDMKWAYYALCNTDINGLGSGSAIPSTTREDFYALPLALPPWSQQRAIAGVLGALDDKIAANTAISKTALDLATTIFHGVVRDAEWSTKTYADVASIGGGGTPRTKVDEYWDGEIRWATPTDITGLTGPYLENTSRHITEAGLQSCASPLYPSGSILMTSRATIGAFAIAEHPTAVNQGFIVVNATDPALQWWVFHDMHDRVDEFLSYANGATFMELSRGSFKKLTARLAEQQEMVNFGLSVGPIHGRARAALLENRRLAATRDALLPGLMSGRIRVKDAERAVEEVV